MRTRPLLSFVLLLGATTAQAEVAAPPSIALKPLEAKLVYADTGTLSDNVLVDGEFTSWNLVIGAGSGRAEDIVILAPVAADSGQFFEFASPIAIVARDQDGNTIAMRSFSAILTSDTGMTYLPLWLQDVACAGKVTVTATMGSATSSATLNLMCGE